MARAVLCGWARTSSQTAESVRMDVLTESVNTERKPPTERTVMNITFEIIGQSCDLALHPVSPQTAEAIRSKGREIYAEKYMNWWRKGNTRTFGMRLGPDSLVRLFVDGRQAELDENLLYRDVTTIRRRMYLNSKAKYLAVLGYDDEWCAFKWIWHDVKSFDPSKFSFQVLNWDRVMKTQGYNVVDNVFYDGHLADDDSWCNPSGFTLIDPMIIDLADVRREVEAEQAGDGKKAA